MLLGLFAAASLALAGTAGAAGITNSADDLRTGWYPDEASLTPQLVASNTFGKLWTAKVDDGPVAGGGQVYAQPLYVAPGTLIVATENDWVYNLDPATGAKRWGVDVTGGVGPWNPGDIGCGDITPAIGTTATPVIDPSTNTIYLTHKSYDGSHNAVWYMDALDVTTGKEKTHFPVQLSGVADNDSSVPFVPEDQQQRPGLLLMDGVVYAGFGSHCDYSPFEGWVFGVSATSGQIKARWASVTSGDGGGIWQAGTGLASDGSGSILLATGNGGAPSTPAPGNSPPTSCGECVLRLHVQPDGKLAPVDFFAPFDAAKLDASDADFGSGGVVGLPNQYFGTSTVPHLAVGVGKEGYVYLLNRDDLGGYKQGTNGDDAVVQRLGPNGGVWGRAGVWPGDGGYIYVPTSCCKPGGGLLDVYKYVNSSGSPSLAPAGSTPDVFGWGSGSPVITSDGTTSGSALVWIIWSANRQGEGGELRAYNAVPFNGQPVFRSPIGTATNYASPGVGGGRIYVGTRDGTVIAFGSPVTQPLAGSALSFPRTTVNTSSAPETLTLTANQDLTINSLTSSSSQFTIGTPPNPPVHLKTGDTLSIPVTFSPTRVGPIGGQLTAATDQGDVSFGLSGTGQATAGQLAASAPHLSLSAAVGGEASDTVSFNNVGGQPLTIKSVQLPKSPFSAPDAPNPGKTTLQPGDSITVTISFDPKSVGSFTDSLELDDSNGGTTIVGLDASAGAPAHMQLSSSSLDFGSVAVGTSATRTFAISNTGGTNLTITRSKPPFGGAFAPATSLQEGTTIAPGQTVTETVTFTPTAPGPASGVWSINSDDNSGLQQVQFAGTGTGTGTGVGGSAAGAPAGPPSGQAPPPPPHPSVLSPPRFKPARVAATRLRGTLISYTATVAGVSRFVLERARAGRRATGRCVAPSSRTASAARCTRFVKVATFSHHDHIGVNQLRLTGYVRVSKLPPGTYRLRSTLDDAAHVKHVFYVTFTVTAAHAPRKSIRKAPRAGAAVTATLRSLRLWVPFLLPFPLD